MKIIIYKANSELGLGVINLHIKYSLIKLLHCVHIKKITFKNVDIVWLFRVT